MKEPKLVVTMFADKLHLKVVDIEEYIESHRSSINAPQLRRLVDMNEYLDAQWQRMQQAWIEHDPINDRVDGDCLPELADIVMKTEIEVEETLKTSRQFIDVQLAKHPNMGRSRSPEGTPRGRTTFYTPGSQHLQGDTSMTDDNLHRDFVTGENRRDHTGKRGVALFVKTGRHDEETTWQQRDRNDITNNNRNQVSKGNGTQQGIHSQPGDLASHAPITPPRKERTQVANLQPHTLLGAGQLNTDKETENQPGPPKRGLMTGAPTSGEPRIKTTFGKPSDYRTKSTRSISLGGDRMRVVQFESRYQKQNQINIGAPSEST